MYGREAHLPADLIYGSVANDAPTVNSEFVDNRRDSLREAYQATRETRTTSKTVVRPTQPPTDLLNQQSGLVLSPQENGGEVSEMAVSIRRPIQGHLTTWTGHLNDTNTIQYKYK